MTLSWVMEQPTTSGEVREGGSELPHQIKREKDKEREREGRKESVWSTVREGKARWGCVRATAVVCERQRKRNENFVWKMKMRNN